jgi:ABC-type Fe3+-siderophore transport system permease subunit
LGILDEYRRGLAGRIRSERDSELQVWEAFLLGSEIPEVGERSLIVWNIRLPRMFVAVLVEKNLAVSGAIFQAVTRNELLRF